MTTAEQIEREWYGWSGPRYKVVDWHVTSDARLLHECGRYVYSERYRDNPPALPSRCWYCGGSV